MDEQHVAELVAVAEQRLAQVEGLTDPVARDAALELVRALLELYGEGLARLVALAAGSALADVPVRLADDELLSHLLLLHGLHPRETRDRIGQALAALGDAAPELVGIDGEQVRLRLPDGGGCGAAATRAAVAEAVRAAAPEITQVDFDEPPAPPVLIPLASVRSGP